MSIPRKCMIVASVTTLFSVALISCGGSESKETLVKKKTASITTADSEWVCPAEAARVNNPFSGDSHATLEGKKTFDQLCFVCHGTTGKGDGQSAAALDPKPADFSSDRVQGQSDGSLFWKMSEGRGAMVPYKTTLTDDQRWQLVNYIRELGGSGTTD